MKLFAWAFLVFSFNAPLQAAIEPVYDGTTGVRNNALTVCLQCHSSTLRGAARNAAPPTSNYDTYAEAIKSGASGVSRAVDGSMPPSGYVQLNLEQKQALQAWQAAGFPERGGIVTDTQSPTAPSGLTGKATGINAVSLSWIASTDNVGVTAYKIYRDGSVIATLSEVTAYGDTGLSAATAYSYSVAACDAAGNCSASSATVSVTTQSAPDTQAPSTPTGLSATATSSSAISLSWTASTDNVGVTAYKIYRGGTAIATLGVVTTYADTGLSAATGYSYGVAACDAAGNCSAQSALASATTQQANVINPSQQADCFFGFAETNYPTIFGPPTQSQSISPYYFRFYAPGTYLAIASNKLLYFGPLTQNTLLDLGDITTWYQTAGCK